MSHTVCDTFAGIPSGREHESETEMPYDREHGVLVWGGTLPGGEAWTNSLRMAETEETLPFTNDTAGWDMQHFLDHYTGILQAHVADTNSFISDRCKLTFVKFNRVDVNGHYVDQTSFINSFAPVSGGRSGNVHPNQVCLTVSFGSAVTRGPASKGRLYSPMPATVIETDGRISVGNAQDAAARYKALVEALSDIPGIDTAAGPGAVLMSKSGTGTKTRRISSVKVGRVLDTQRRRRRNLAEAYEELDVDQGAF